MTFRFGLAWFLLPLLAVVGAFGYTSWVFGVYHWGYLGLMIAWVLAFSVGFALVTVVLPRNSCQVEPFTTAPVNVAWDTVILMIGAFAIVALFYDRYHFRSIDYFSVGVAKSRSILNEGGHSSTFFSIFGNFFLYSYVFPLIRSLHQWEERKSRTLFWILLFVFVELAVVSYLMGGRTAILLTIMVCCGCFVVRSLVGKSYCPEFFTPLRLLGAGVAALVAFGLFFFLRSNAFGGGDSYAYYMNICGHLTQGTSLNCDFGVTSGPWKNLLNYFHLVILYGFHGVWFSEIILTDHFPEGLITPQGFYAVFLSRFGLDAPPSAFEGYWVPAGASLMNDYGILGMISLALLFGAVTAVGVSYIRAGRLGGSVYISVFLIASWFLSFLIFPLNVPGLLLSMLLGLFLGGVFVISITVKQLVGVRFL